MRRLNQNGQIDPYIGLYGTGRTLIYAFCGLQSNCSLEATTTAGEERVLRREALELSLYAFKYLKNVDQVVSLVQTVKAGGTSAVFLRKSDLQPELDHPLRNTLPLRSPPRQRQRQAGGGRDRRAHAAEHVPGALRVAAGRRRDPRARRLGAADELELTRVSPRLRAPVIALILARVRRGSIIQLVAIGLVAAAIATAVALLVPWLPVAAGKEATRIHFVFWFTTAICIGVFAVVAAVLTYSVWKFRVKPDDDSDGPPTHGHTALEIVWTAVPAVLVTAISIVSAIVLAENGNAGSDPLIVKVTGAAVRLDVHLSERQEVRLADDSQGPAHEARRSRRTTSSTPSGCRSCRRSRTLCPAQSTRS